MTLSDRLRAARERSGKSARAVSLAAGLSPNTVAEIESTPARSPRVEAIQKIARVLGVSVDYLIEGHEREGARDGLSENDAAPWTPRRSAGERPDLADHQRKLAQTLCPDARSPTTYSLRAAMPGFALMKGDVLIVDLNKPARTGDLVLATFTDLTTGTGVTVLRRFLAPYLVANDADSDADMLVVDNARTSIMGVVCGSFRSRQLQE